MLKHVFSINKKKILELAKNEELNNISKKYPSNVDMCKRYLEKLNNKNVKIEEDNNKETSLYIAITNKIVIANINNADSKVREDLTKEVVNTMVEGLVNLNDKMSLDELKQLVGDQFTKVKYKKVLDTSEIERVYKDAINDYVDKIDDLRIGKNE